MKHIHIDVCDSTQDVVKEQLNHHQSSEHILVSCNHQLKGKGRGSNEWSVMPGTLCFSLTVIPHPVPSFSALELSVLIARYFEEAHRIELRLKWPNDLLNDNGFKTCGILIQSHSNRMIAGIGINLFSDSPLYGGVFEEEFQFDKFYWSNELAHFILNNRYTDAESLCADWIKRCAHFNQKVSITEGSDKTVGLFIGLGPYGEALLQASDSTLHLFNGSLRIIS